VTAEPEFTLREVMDRAAEKAGIEGWQGYRWQASEGDDSIITGCVPSGVISRGPRKGRPKFRPPQPGTERIVVVSKAEMLALAAEFERSGTCWDCKGSGEVVASSGINFRNFRPCKRCAATGRTPQQTGEKA